MKKLPTVLAALLLILTGGTASAEEYIVGLTITPFVSKVNGLQQPVQKEIKITPGESLLIDLGVFQTELTVEEHGQEMTFTFDHDLELFSSGITAETHRIVLGKDSTAHLRTPTMDAGAWLALSWGPDDMPLVYRDFIRSMTDILNGIENFRYGSYEDYSIMFEVQSARGIEERSLGYAVKDIDGDGTEELLFGDMNADTTGTPLYDLYTIQNGEMIHVFDGWDRNRYYLTTDGGFLRQASNSAFNSFTAYYVYTQGELHLIRSVIYDSERNKSQPWFLSYTNVLDPSSSFPISEEEARKRLSYCSGEQIELTAFGK